MNLREVRFLSVENVMQIHDDTLREEGGLPGIRDLGLLESAVAMPRAMYDGAFLHLSLAEMAAAYLFHLCQNHPFVDGNKRTAAFSCILFLAVNGIPDDDLPNPSHLEVLTLDVASGNKGKAEVTDYLRSHGPYC
jgi:death-on-curing protein